MLAGCHRKISASSLRLESGDRSLQVGDDAERAELRSPDFKLGSSRLVMSMGRWTKQLPRPHNALSSAQGSPPEIRALPGTTSTRPRWPSATRRCRSPEVHNWLLYRLPEQHDTTVLDIGAGSGRDAAWLAGRGHEVVAVEPAQGLLREGRRRHPHPRIRWLSDRLPDLAAVNRLGVSFDVILLSAVWMHVPPSARAFRKLTTLLKPGGLLAMTLRQGPVEKNRNMYTVSVDEVRRLAREHGASVEAVSESLARMGRGDVSWSEIAIRLPDDGTGALPLLRHIILNDDKSSTYKLAFLRCLCRIADGANGMARYDSDEHVDLPFGLVALTWIRAFQPLIAHWVPLLYSRVQCTP